MEGIAESIDGLVLPLIPTPMDAVRLTLIEAGLFLGLFLLVGLTGWASFYLRFILRNLLRNWLRTGLTAMATMVLVLVVTLVWTILWFLNNVTSEKAKDLKAIISERWQLPSQMPFSYEADLSEGAPSKEGDYKVDTSRDAMTWQFYAGTLDPAKRTRENIMFFFCMDPVKLLTVNDKAIDEAIDSLPISSTYPYKVNAEGKMIEDKVVTLDATQRSALKEIDQARRDGRITSMMDGLDEMKPEELVAMCKAIKLSLADKRKVVIGKDRLKAINKQVGESFKLTSINYKEIDLEFEVAGVFPDGRYNQSAVMHRDYLNAAMDDYNRKNVGKKHPLSEKSLNLVWIRVPNTQTFQKVETQINNSSKFQTPAVKCETASSGVASFLDAYRDLLWGMRWILVPFILLTMSLIIAVAISISVRERRKEMAILKVLGFAPGQILIMVMGEAMMVGVLSGVMGSVATFAFINYFVGGIKFPIAFFPAFLIPVEALAWGPSLGALTAILGSVIPSLNACRIKVSEVFARIS
jgi:putative ABC transport system permease protein